MSARTLRRLLAWLTASVLALAVAQAQVPRARPTGDVSGVDLQIEGALEAHRGTPMRLVFTAFDVLGLDRLRRAEGVRVVVTASFARDRPVAEVTTDAHGRALAEFVVPGSQEQAFRLAVEARGRGGVIRRYELPVTVAEAHRLEVATGPRHTTPGSAVQIVGRAFDASTGQALAAERLEVQISGPHGPLVTGRARLTGPDGVFTDIYTLAPDAPAGSYRVEVVRPGARRLAESTHFQVGGRPSMPLLVSVAPERVLVAPGSWVQLTVLVRRPDGRPVEGARVKTLAGRDDVSEARTDARGRAVVRARVPADAAGVVDTELAVEVVRASLGSVRAAARVRVASRRYLGRLSYEGGVVSTRLGGRAYVRVVDARGLPAADVPVAFAGTRLRGGVVRGRTDAFGVASFELAVVDPPAARRARPSAPRRDPDALDEDGAEDDTTEALEADADRCGGTVATHVEVTIGDGAAEGSVDGCMPLDPDATLRLRAPAEARPGDAIAVELLRAPDASRAPVVIDALVRGPGEGHRLLSTVIAPAGARSVSVPTSTDAAGDLWLRARLLHGEEALELRGASALVRLAKDPTYALSATYDAARGTVRVESTDAPADVRVVAFAMPFDEFAEATLGARFESQTTGLGTSSADDQPRGGSWVAAQLAERVPLDHTVAFARIDGVVTPLPAPESPEASGRLRDPYRARARFVAGRLALLFRALEDRVEACFPGCESTVAHREGDRWVLNEQVLAAVAEGDSLGAEGATGLGGAPIGIAELRALDPGFGFDAIARRVTRRRLFRVLVRLREFVVSNGFDLAWARPGDPRTWVERLLETSSDAGYELEPRDLVDGWGRPLQLTSTARPRFTRVQPVEGYELISLGPDGRAGSGDDVYDPTARVLPVGSLYARAVGEDGLVARLRGVDLSRATLSQLGDAIGIGGTFIHPPDTEDPTGGYDPSPAFPPMLFEDPEPLALRRVGRTTPSVHLGSVALRGGSVELPLALGPEPSSLGVAVVGMTPSGAAATTFLRATIGAPVILHGDLPSRVHVGEPLVVDLALTNVADAPRTVRLTAHGCDGAQVAVPAAIEVPAGLSVPFELRVTADRPGGCDARVEAHDGERLVATLTRRVEGSTGQHPERRRVVGLLDASGGRFDVAAPADASRAVVRVTAVAPSAVFELPDLAQLAQRHPSLLGYARVAATGGLDDALRDRILRALEDPTSPPTQLDYAAAFVALAARVDDREARAAVDAIRPRLGGILPVASRTPSAGHRRSTAATVALLALSGVPDWAEESVSDPVAAAVRSMVIELRRTVRDADASPAEAATAAAAILLVDPSDAHGRALYRRALDASVACTGGRCLPEADGREPHEARVGALALAVAAGALGERPTALRFARPALAALPELARGALDGPVWLAVLGAYGTLAVDASPRIELEVAGARSTHTLGTAPIVLTPSGSGRADVSARVLGEGFALVEAEVAYERPFVASDDGPLALSIEGDVGPAYGVTALELVVRATAFTDTGVVELELPPSVPLDTTLLEALRRAPGVREVTPRAGGFVRLELAPLSLGAELRIPLPLALEGRGRVTGLAASAYDATRSYARTVLPPRVVDAR